MLTVSTPPLAFAVFSLYFSFFRLFTPLCHHSPITHLHSQTFLFTFFIRTSIPFHSPLSVLSFLHIHSYLNIITNISLLLLPVSPFPSLTHLPLLYPSSLIMSIFHIPELFDLIRPEIAKQDLVHCCRVNKSWNAAFTPTLWQYFPPDPPTKRYDRHQWRTRIYACLRSLIEEDLLYEQEQEQEHTQSGDTLDRFNNSNNDDANVLLPALTRNGHWFRTLIIDQQMLKAPFRQQSYQITSVPPPDPIAATASTASVHRHRHHTHNPRLDTPGILLHLLMRCSNLQSLQLAGQDIDAAAYHFWKRIATVGFPGSSKDLNIKISSCVPMVQSTILPLLFHQCLLGLHKLRIDFVPWKNRLSRVVNAVADTREVEVMEPLPSLRDLRIVSGTPGSSPESCGQFLGRCINLKA